MNIKFGDSSLNLKVDGSLANIDRGPRGYSAYEIAVQEGFAGTEEEWLASLVGPEGKQGKDGERGIQGPRGQQGDKGDRGDTGPQGEKGDRGDTGPQGDKGDIGPQGEKGDTGPSNVLSIGSVTKGDEANATITGESPNQILNLVLPKGDKGDKGDKGEKGEKGDTGPQGETGATGNGILSIQKTATAGLVDTYTTTFTNGTTTTFDVTNGEDGEVTQKQLDETNENVSWLQTLTDQMPTVSGQGTDLSLENVLNYRLMKFLPQGVSSQESTTGSNIIGLDNEQYHVNLRAGDKIVVTNETDSTVTIDLFTNYGDTTRNDYWTITTAQSPRVITIANDSLAIKWHSVPNGKAWANLGETALPYEPYTDGPAPNPSYPYPVNNVTGENSLVICNENLFNKNSITPNSYLDSDGNIITNTTWSISDYIPVIAGENYVYKWLTAVGNAPMSCYYDENKNFVSSFKQTTYGTKITIPTGVKYVRFTIETKNTDDLNTFMFIKGSTAPSTYIANQTQTYQLSLGNIELNSSPDGTIRDQIKGSSDVSYNLFDKNNVIKGNYQINSSQTLISSNSNRTLFIPCKPNTTYTVSKKISNYFTIGFINEEPSANISVTGYMRNASLEYLTSTSDSDSKYLACWYYNTGETLTEQEILDSIQITEGSEAKPYFPYGQVGMWYKREYIGKVVFDGVNNVFTAKSNTNFNQLYISDEISNMVVPSNNNVLGKGLSSHFKIKTAQNIYANDLIGFGVRTDNKISFGFGASSDLTTLALANQWLQTQYNDGTPVTTYYLHVNYVDIPITDTTLINQLNDIYNNAHSNNGVTNITTTYEDGNEQMYLDIEALAKGGSTTTETDPVFSASASSGITSSDITSWNNKADVEDIPDLTDYVKNTDYASSSKGGAFKTSSTYKVVVDPIGTLRTTTVAYTDYGNLNNSAFIGKGTLENVISGKNLADKNYVDTAIATAITNTLGGSY